MNRIGWALGLTLAAWCAGTRAQAPEDVYRGESIAYPGPWGFGLPKSAIILVSDAQLDALTDPDAPVDLGITGTPELRSLRQVCEQARARGARTLIFAYDYFFAQYQKDAERAPRRYTPDSDAYIERIAKIAAVAKEYGLGLELSLLSPLEIGPGYAAKTGESGLWMHYREGLRDPVTGAYSVELWRQSQWANNKGIVPIGDAGVRVFAFRERRIGGTAYRAVRPEEIVEISEGAAVEVYPRLEERHGDFRAQRVRVHGAGNAAAKGLDRVLVVQQYRTPEMDYFSESAQPFLHGLVDRYADAGVTLHGLYADEMHIQQDWHYHVHHDAGQFALRYVSPGFQRRFAERYGAEYADFAKWLVYFAYAQEDFAGDVRANEYAMHAIGESPEEVRRTALLRARYYRLLHDGVVDLFAGAKRHAEARMGHALESRAHATWAQSPACDAWRGSPGEPLQARHYEYTSNFIWSNTVQQASAACDDYFKWGDFLTGNGNDHTEGGFLDRNYTGLALACSTGSINAVPYSYGAHWGMPEAVSRRRTALVNVFGAAAEPWFAAVQESAHRDTPVLMLYPLNLVASEERFGSWMSQYPNANYITQAKLLELGRIEGDAIVVAGRRHTTLCALFEPFPEPALLAMMQQLADAGGRVVWSGPPPVIAWDGSGAVPAWQALTGVQYAAGIEEGLRLPGCNVEFEGVLAGLAPMTVLTDFMVDRVYPIAPEPGVEAAARVGGQPVGALRRTPAGGAVLTLGFRPRDDQAASLGYETRYWFDALGRIGAYPPSGRFGERNDHPEHLSRTSNICFARFPNGAIAAAPHLRNVVEQWPGGFVRKAETDDPIVARLTLPGERLALDDMAVAGHTLRYAGDGAVCVRPGAGGIPIAFAGRNCNAIAIDGIETVFADAPLPLVAWAPVAAARRVEGGALLQFFVHGGGTLRLPDTGLPPAVALYAEGPTPGSRGAAIAHTREPGALVVPLVPEAQGRWVYALAGE